MSQRVFPWREIVQNNGCVFGNSLFIFLNRYLLRIIKCHILQKIAVTKILKIVFKSKFKKKMRHFYTLGNILQSDTLMKVDKFNFSNEFYLTMTFILRDFAKFIKIYFFDLLTMSFLDLFLVIDCI